MLVWFIASSLAQAQTPCDAAAYIDAALDAVIAGDTTSARNILDLMDDVLACGPPISQETLATWWIVDGAVLELQGDQASAQGSYGSAKALAPQVWPALLSTWLRQTYDTAQIPVGRSQIRVDPDPLDRPVWIDGVPRTSLEVSAGLHLVQIGDLDGQPVFADTVWVDPGVTSVVNAPLPEEIIPADPVGTPFPPGVQVHGLVGPRLAAGAPLTAPGLTPESGVKVSMPVELVVRGTFDPLWIRVQLGVGPLLEGQFLYQDIVGRVYSLPVHVDMAAGGGIQLGAFHVGAIGGMQWPARIAARALVGYSPKGPWITELRAGLHFPTERSPEPMAEWLIGVTTR